MPKEAEGKVVASNSLDASEPGVSAAYEVDMALGPMMFPRETYSAENALDLSIEGDQS